MSESTHHVKMCGFCELISPAKLSGLDVSGADPHSAYFLSLEAGMRLWPTLSLVELGVRNLFSVAIERHFGSKFFLQDIGVLTRKHLKRFPWFERSRPAADANQVVSALAMGFWTDLTSRRYESTIWASVLVESLSLPVHVSREEFSLRLRQATIIRNRIAHHESILKTRFKGIDSELRELLSWISPSALEELDRFQVGILYTP